MRDIRLEAEQDKRRSAVTSRLRFLSSEGTVGLTLSTWVSSKPEPVLLAAEHLARKRQEGVGVEAYLSPSLWLFQPRGLEMDSSWRAEAPFR
jgi:hypothetical protein